MTSVNDKSKPKIKMKKLIFFLVLLFQFEGNIFAQIIATGSTNKSITISPIGIIGIQNNKNISNTNTGLGENALIATSTTVNNTAIGNQTLVHVGTNAPNAYNGNNNTAVGFWTLQKNTQGYDNAAFGEFAMYSASSILGNTNTAFGVNSMYSITSGNNNAAFGINSLTNLTSGSNNAAFGFFSMKVNQSSNNHLAFGVNALQNHITNDNNTAIGEDALAVDQSGTNNVAIGYGSLQSITSGSLNTGVGYKAMTYNKIGIGNVAFGNSSLQTNDGQNNTVAGFTTFAQNTTGSNIVAIGLYALHLNITGSGIVAIGSLAGYNETGSNKLYIDNAFTQFAALIPAIGGDFATNKVCIACNMANTGVNDFSTRSETFQVTGNAFKTLGSGLWIFPSDRRLKTKIVSLNRAEMLAKIFMMQGVNYELSANPEQGKQYGFIAQDLRKIFPTKVYENKVGYLSSSYGDYVPMFVEALKALNERVEKLEENKFDVKALTARVEAMEKLINN